jgi:hypothetical protein
VKNYGERCGKANLKEERQRSPKKFSVDAESPHGDGVDGSAGSVDSSPRPSFG